MKTTPPHRKSRVPAALAAVAVVLATGPVARSQFRPQPGGAPRPVIPRPVPQPVPQPRRVFPPPQPPRPFIPPQPFVPQQVVVTVYRCGRCNKEVGRGVRPTVTRCPHCGARFADGNQLVAANGPAGAPSVLGTTFYGTVAAEGALLGGMVLVGLIQLAAERSRRRVLAAEEG
jgi:hypothetical protein